MVSCISLAGVTSGSSACLSVQLDPLLLYHYDIGEKLLSLHTVLHTYMHASNLYFTMFLISWLLTHVIVVVATRGSSTHASMYDSLWGYRSIKAHTTRTASQRSNIHVT